MAVLHRASWVVPVTSPPFKQGGVVVDDGRIVEVGLISALQSAYDRTVDHGKGILMPGLVNGHAHLELSHFKAIGTYSKPGDMVSWIEELLASRESEEFDVSGSAVHCTQQLEGSGVDLILDIGNDPSFARNHGITTVLFFHELLGLSDGAYDFMKATMVAEQKQDYTCHAPYSTNLKLLREVKAQSRIGDKLFPIHVAESVAETEFLQTGEGDFRRFIEARGSWDGSFKAPGCSAVQYLAENDLLDERTLCVHCVQIDATDIRTLQETGAGVCLCPGSNLYLGVGLPPVGDVLNAGIRPCLGTDSLASNPVLSIWREMNLLHDHFPAISAEEILAMATINGAHALHQPKYGQLQKGGVSMIFVDYDGNTPLNFLSFDLTPKNVSRCM